MFKLWASQSRIPKIKGILTPPLNTTTDKTMKVVRAYIPSMAKCGSIINQKNIAGGLGKVFYKHLDGHLEEITGMETGKVGEINLDERKILYKSSDGSVSDITSLVPKKGAIGNLTVLGETIVLYNGESIVDLTKEIKKAESGSLITVPIKPGLEKELYIYKSINGSINEPILNLTEEIARKKPKPNSLLTISKSGINFSILVGSTGLINNITKEMARANKNSVVKVPNHSYPEKVIIFIKTMMVL